MNNIEQQSLPPPRSEIGVLGWLRKNLFSSVSNTLLTFVAGGFLFWLLPPLFEWAILDSIWSAGSRKECWAKMEVPEGAACWAFIKDRLGLFVYGFYPIDQRWRVDLSFVLLVCTIFCVLYEKLPGKKYGLMFAIAFPFITGWLLIGGFGLEPIETDRFV